MFCPPYLIASACQQHEITGVALAQPRGEIQLSQQLSASTRLTSRTGMLSLSLSLSIVPLVRTSCWVSWWEISDIVPALKTRSTSSACTVAFLVLSFFFVVSLSLSLFPLEVLVSFCVDIVRKEPSFRTSAVGVSYCLTSVFFSRVWWRHSLYVPAVGAFLWQWARP